MVRKSFCTGKVGDVCLLRVIGEFIYLLLQEKKQIQEQSQPCTWRAVCLIRASGYWQWDSAAPLQHKTFSGTHLRVSCSGAELLKEKMKFGKLKSPVIMVPKYVFFSQFCWCPWSIHCFYTTQKMQLLWISVTPCCSVGVLLPRVFIATAMEKRKGGITVWLKERIEYQAGSCVVDLYKMLVISVCFVLQDLGVAWDLLPKYTWACLKRNITDYSEPRGKTLHGEL